MNRVLFLATLLAPAAAAIGASPATKPNVVILIADDLGYGDVSCLSHGAIHTPNLDRLAASGVRFTSGYVTASLCAPSRAGFLTGQYQQRFGFVDNDRPIPSDLPLLPGVLRQAGYYTGFLGKWHSMGPGLHERGVVDEAWTAPKPGPWLEYFDPTMARNGKVEKHRGYITDLLADEAEAFIDRNRGRPFSLTVSFNAPHIGPIKDKFFIHRQRYDEARAAGRVYDVPKSPTARPGEAEKYAAQFPGDRARTDAAAAIVALDQAIGRILDQVARCGLEKNTVIFFFADNGGHPENRSENGPLRDYKWSLYEGGIRVPFMAAYSGVFPAGMSFHAPVSTLDIFPTVLNLAGIGAPAGLDGVNLAPWLQGKRTGALRDALYFSLGGYGAVREDRWKLVLAPGGKAELYDLEKDIGETENLAGADPERAKEMAAKWKRWHAQMPPPAPRKPAK